MTTRSPLKWYGGKAKLATRIVGYIPPHARYVEVFGGAGSILFAKPPAKVEVYNDLDAEVVNFMRVLRNPLKHQQLADQLRLTPYARDEHAFCQRERLDPDDAVERARRLFVRVRQSRNGVVDGTWRYARDGGDVEAFVNSIDLLAPACERIAGVRIENRDFGKLIETWDDHETLFYLDPPYVSGTRVAPQMYRHEMDDAAHARLLDLLLRLKGMAIVSGYASELYDQRLTGWERIEISTRCWSSPSEGGARRQKAGRTEVLWINPAAVAARRVGGGLPLPSPASCAPRRRRSRAGLAAPQTGSVRVAQKPDASLVLPAGEPYRAAAVPPELFEELNEEFGFDLDVRAEPAANEANALGRDWGTRTCWLDLSGAAQIPLWLEKGYKSSRCGATVVCLLPVRTDARWWHDWATKADEVRSVRALSASAAPNDHRIASASLPSAVVVFRRRRLETDLFGDELADLRRLWGVNGLRLAPWLHDAACSLG